MKISNRTLIIITVISGLSAILQMLMPFILKCVIKAITKPVPSNEASAGIIGGSDGPTAIFITSSKRQAFIDACCLIINICVMIGSVAVLFIRSKAKKESKSAPSGL